MAAVFATIVLVLSGPAQADGFKTDFTVDLERYAGVWHEYARTPNSFEDNTPRRDGEVFSACFDVTATYTLESDTDIGVLNECMREAPSGARMIDRANGAAQVIDGSGGRKLSVVFGPGIARFIQRLLSGRNGNYWIYCLDPSQGSEAYDWAVVSGPDRDYIFVLTRTPNITPERRDTILSCARSADLPVEDLIFTQRSD